jgi:hypothetical protein
MNLNSYFHQPPVVFAAEPLTSSEEHLHAKAIERAHRYLETEVDLLSVIMEVDQTKLYFKFDLGSTFSYCLKYLKLSEAVTYSFINVARKASQVPALKDSIDQGELSVSKARKIVPILTVENSEEWIQKAITLPQSKLEREVAEVSPETSRQAQERVRPAKGHLVKVEILLKEETMELWRRAQKFVSEDQQETSDLETTLAIVLKDFVDRNDPLKKAERATGRANAKAKNTAKAKTKAQTKTAKNPATSQTDNINCDSNLSRDNPSCKQTVREPLPAEALHAVNLRDQRQCQAARADGSLCQARNFLQIHHIVPVALGGKNTLDNLITLCGSCHRRWHRQE